MAVTGSFYGRASFDPLLILSQIILLQSVFYISDLLFLLLFNYATGTSASLVSQMFDPSYTTLRHFPGWITCLSLLLSACGPTAVAFVLLVGRAKRATDFALTLLISHIVAVSVRSGIPTRAMWWVLNAIAVGGLAIVAEMLSMRVEMREISVGKEEEDTTSSEV